MTAGAMAVAVLYDLPTVVPVRAGAFEQRLSAIGEGTGGVFAQVSQNVGKYEVF
jgi:hypothetical protein